MHTSIASRSRPWVADIAVQDGAVGLYLAVLLFAVLRGGGLGQPAALAAVTLDITLYAVGLGVFRGFAGAPRARALGYRLLGPLVVTLSYFQLRSIMPAVTGASFDRELLAIDLAVFGFEPALAWDRFVTPATTEWFAVFYFGYFIVLATYLGAMVFACRDPQRLAAFGLGILSLFCLAHLTYLVVPGYGPYAALADQLTRPLDGGVAWRLVERSVAAGGAMQDIFPSLHTAAPTFLTLFSLRHRRIGRHRRWWWVLALITSQIIIATMFLRWHYLIDVVAGLALAVGVEALAHRVARWEHLRRTALGLPPVFEPLTRRRAPARLTRGGGVGVPSTARR